MFDGFASDFGCGSTAIYSPLWVCALSHHQSVDVARPPFGKLRLLVTHVSALRSSFQRKEVVKIDATLSERKKRVTPCPQGKATAPQCGGIRCVRLRCRSACAVCSSNAFLSFGPTPATTIRYAATTPLGPVTAPNQRLTRPAGCWCVGFVAGAQRRVFIVLPPTPRVPSFLLAIASGGWKMQGRRLFRLGVRVWCAGQLARKCARRTRACWRNVAFGVRTLFRERDCFGLVAIFSCTQAECIRFHFRCPPSLLLLPRLIAADNPLHNHHTHARTPLLCSWIRLSSHTQYG
jgi:hypothetical protein